MVLASYAVITVDGASRMTGVVVKVKAEGCKAMEGGTVNREEVHRAVEGDDQGRHRLDKMAQSRLPHEPAGQCRVNSDILERSRKMGTGRRGRSKREGRSGLGKEEREGRARYDDTGEVLVGEKDRVRAVHAEEAKFS